MRNVKRLGKLGFSDRKSSFELRALDDLWFYLSRYLNVGFDFFIHLINNSLNNKFVVFLLEIPVNCSKKKEYLIEHVLEAWDLVENSSRILHLDFLNQTSKFFSTFHVPLGEGGTVVGEGARALFKVFFFFTNFIFYLRK